MSRSLSGSLALFLLCSTAGAAPLTLQHQGRLHDAVGIPLDGQHDLTIGLYDNASGGSAGWTETLTGIDFDQGYFSVVLGESTALDPALFDDDTLWMGMAVDSGAEFPIRLQVNSVPFAVRAHGVSGGIVDASEIRVDGNTVIDSSGAITATVAWGDITGAPATLGALTCSNGQITVYNGSWGCGDLPTPDIDTSNVVSGVFDVARLPVGGGGTQVAAGDHTHSAYADASHAHSDYADVGHAHSDIDGLAGGNLTSSVSVAGHVQVSDSSATCDATTAGAIRFDTTAGALQFCDGGTWQLVAGGPGHSSTTPATSCKTLRDAGTTIDGLYWIDPNGGSNADATQVWCDMTTDGGGWSVCLRFDMNTDASVRALDGSAFTTTFGTPAAPPAAYSSDCTTLLTGLGDAQSFDLLSYTHVVETDNWQWVGPMTVAEWRSVYDLTSCGNSGPNGVGAITQCRGSSTSSVVDVSSQSYRMGYHWATGGSCANDSSTINQFAAGTNSNVLLELNHGMNWGHGLYLHYDCQAACSHPCNGCDTGSGPNNTYGNGADRTLITQPGAPGTSCGAYQATSTATRPTVSFAFRER